MPFVKDDPRINREGRPKGSNNFETDFDEAVEEIAKENNMTRSECRKLLLKVAFKNAKEGNYSFYKDIHDRLYGQAVSKTEHTGKDGKDLIPDTLIQDKVDSVLNNFLNGNKAK